jgi:beta-lactamase superfamily II metal-dependent hydrolase
MRLAMFLFLKVLYVFVLCSLQCFADQLNVYFFNVGQASFTLLRTNTHAVVIDCGTTRLPKL